MEKENGWVLMEILIKDNGKKVNPMGLEFKFGEIKINIKGNF